MGVPGFETAPHLNHLGCSVNNNPETLLACFQPDGPIRFAKEVRCLGGDSKTGFTPEVPAEMYPLTM